MGTTVKELLAGALQLPEDQRAALVEEILRSLPSSFPGEDRSNEEWIAEVERRARAALAGAPAIGWSESKVRIQNKLGSS